MHQTDTRYDPRNASRRWDPVGWARAIMGHRAGPAHARVGQAPPEPALAGARSYEREWSGPMEPKEFAEAILRDHEERRQVADRPWRWGDDPEWSSVVALAAMATRWNVDGPGFEAKLERLCRLPTGTARPAAERLLALWRARQAATRN